MKGFPPDNASRLLPEDTGPWYETRVGLPRPDWKKVRQWISEKVPADQSDLAWCQAACDWLSRLGEALGPEYVLHESRIFLMLMSAPDGRARRMLQLLEGERRRICRFLGGAANENYSGKPVAIVLSGEDQYYSYVSDFFPLAGHFGRSAAVFVNDGYGHIVTPADDPDKLRNTIAHETVHNCLMHLPLPHWLNEGLAVNLSYSQTYSFENWTPHVRAGSPLDELARLRRRLTSQTIQQFWSGKSFSAPDEVATFSYILASELTRRLCRKRRFKEFVLNAQNADAGASAALNILKIDLGQVVAEFLGPGEWGPRPSRPDRPGSAWGTDGISGKDR